MGEANQAKWFGIRPTDPEEEIPVKQDTAANLKATVTQASIARTVTGEVDATVLFEKPDGATQIALDSYGDNGTQVIHTVNTGKTLYLSAASFSFMNLSGGTLYGYMFVTNASDVEQYRIFNIAKTAGNGGVASISFTTHLEIPAGYKVKTYSSGADGHAAGFISGYER